MRFVICFIAATVLCGPQIIDSGLGLVWAALLIVLGFDLITAARRRRERDGR